MFQGAITVQSTSTIMAVGYFSWVKLLPLVDRSTSPYITGISDQDYLALRAGYSQAVQGGNFSSSTPGNTPPLWSSISGQ